MPLHLRRSVVRDTTGTHDAPAVVAPARAAPILALARRHTSLSARQPPLMLPPGAIPVRRSAQAKPSKKAELKTLEKHVREGFRCPSRRRDFSAPPDPRNDELKRPASEVVCENYWRDARPQNPLTASANGTLFSASNHLTRGYRRSCDGVHQEGRMEGMGL